MEKLNVKYVITKSETSTDFLKEFLILRKKIDNYRIFEAPFESSYYEIPKYKPIIVYSNFGGWTMLNEFLFTKKDLIDLPLIWNGEIMSSDIRKKYFNIYYLATENKLKIIKDLEALKEPMNYSAEIKNFSYSDSKIRFFIDSKSPVPVILKFSYFPMWQSNVDSFATTPNFIFVRGCGNIELDFDLYPTDILSLVKYSSPFMKELRDAWRWIEYNTEKNSNIAYTNTNLIYFLYGSDYDKNIFYLNMSSYENWLGDLKKNKIDYIFISKMDVEKVPEEELIKIEKLPIEYAFALDESKFEPVYETDYVAIFKVVERESKQFFKVINIGMRDEKYVKNGWHEKETDEFEGYNFRWCGKKKYCDINIELPIRNITLFVRMHGIKDDESKTIEIRLNNILIKKIVFERVWGTIEANISENMINSELGVEKSENNLSFWADQTFRIPGEERNLSIAVDYIAFVER